MQTIKTSVVIVGSWWAWLRCAIHLWENGFKDILIVWDRMFNDPHTTQARGWINAALHTMDAQDNPLIHAVDTFREWACLAHPDLVETLTTNAPSAIDDLERWGAEFHHEVDGRLTQRFFGAHSYRRTCFSWDQTGKEMIRVMSSRSRELEIPFLENLYVYKLLQENNSVKWVLWVKDDEIYHIQAPLVVFATGWFSNTYFRSSSRSKENFGDGIGMALRAWAMIGDIELVQFHPTGLLRPEEKFGELVTEAVRGEGWILRNAKGERFMEKYDPVKLELSTRDVVARANFAEIHEGRGTPKGWVYLDISHRSKEYIMERLPKMYSMILEYNWVDLSKEPVEVAPTTHYTMGGIRFDAHTMKTNLQWFYVAGECTMGVHGANRLGGNSLMETMVFGKLVAEKILAADKTPKEYSLDESELHLEYIREGWIDAESTMQDVRKNVREYAWIVRVEHELVRLQVYLANIQKNIEQIGIAPKATKLDSFQAANRLMTVLELAQLICKGALERKESRWAHYRIDYPTMSSDYDKNYIHQMINGEIVSTRKDVPAPSERLQQGLEIFGRTKNYGHVE